MPISQRRTPQPSWMEDFGEGDLTPLPRKRKPVKPPPIPPRPEARAPRVPMTARLPLPVPQVRHEQHGRERGPTLREAPFGAGPHLSADNDDFLLDDRTMEVGIGGRPRLAAAWFALWIVFLSVCILVFGVAVARRPDDYAPQLARALVGTLQAVGGPALRALPSAGSHPSSEHATPGPELGRDAFAQVSEPVAPVSEPAAAVSEPVAAAPVSQSVPRPANEVPAKPVDERAAEAAEPSSTSATRQPVRPGARAALRPEARVPVQRAARAAQRPSAPPAPKPSLETGFLRINAHPWAEIYVDDKFVGHTPQTKLELTAGMRRIRLDNPDFDLTKTVSIRIRPGVTKTRVVSLLD